MLVSFKIVAVATGLQFAIRKANRFEANQLPSDIIKAKFILTAIARVISTVTYLGRLDAITTDLCTRPVFKALQSHEHAATSLYSTIDRSMLKSTSKDASAHKL